MSDRISLLDAWRGVACYLMLVYHLLFDFVIFGWMEYEVMQMLPMILFEKLIAYSFILCAGISATMTRSNVKRGLEWMRDNLFLMKASQTGQGYSITFRSSSGASWKVKPQSAAATSAMSFRESPMPYILASW